MSKKLVAGTFILSIIFYALFTHVFTPEASSLLSPLDRYEIKHAPNDLFFQQKFYPSEKPQHEAYKNALRQVDQLKLRRNAPSGFQESWTVQGPGNAGARVNAIAVQNGNEDVIYAGFSGGGIFKTVDGGINWIPIFDDQPYLSIGDITIDPNNSQVIYVGTGDPNISGYPFIGDGVYKSTDGGISWTQSGLIEQNIISKVIVDPSNSSVVYAAAMGKHYEHNADRGVYKSTDSGQTWTQSLFISDTTGIIDMVINPLNPNILYAAGWDRIRTNNESIVFGEGARIYRSEDAGNTWEHLTNGLPSGINSRIGIDIFQSNPDHIYAMYIGTDFQHAGIYKSENGGDTWFEISSGTSNGLNGNAMGGQGWYLGKFRVHPSHPGELFLLGVRLWKTSNDGATWLYATPLTGPQFPHVDNHDLVFAEDETIYLATDGGLYRKEETSTVWNDIENIPATQFYRTGYNPHRPDLFYAGAQDNGTQHGMAEDLNNWSELFGADGFQPVFHPTDSNIFYVETQNGGIRMTQDAGNGFLLGISGLNSSDRKNWDMPYIMSPHNSNVLYTGTYRIYKSESNSYPEWNTISESLTHPVQTNSGFHNISTLDESPINEGLLYVGTSDGRVWRSDDGGSNWIEISMGLPNRYVTSIKASGDNGEYVYVSHSGYKNGSYIPHVHLSTDRGNTWTDISGDLPTIAINDLFLMPGYQGMVIFAATDGGVFATLNGGVNWNFLGSNMPTIPVYDMDLHVEDNLLIAATYARSLRTFPLDSIGVGAEPPLLLSLSGSIQTEEGDAVNNVKVTHPSGNAFTDSTGVYSYQAFQQDEACDLLPIKDTLDANGVNTFDVILMQKHILFIDTLVGPYKRIAADVNNSGQINVFDLIQIRRLILFFDSTFNANTSWRFIPSDYNFPDPGNPTAAEYPQFYDCEDFVQNQSDLDFVAVKIGDLNESASTNTWKNNESAKDRNEGIAFYIKDQYVKANEKVEVVFSSKEIEALHGFQFNLTWNPEFLEFVEVNKNHTIPLSNEFYNKNVTKQGQFYCSWSSSTPFFVKEGEGLFSISFRAKQELKLSDIITLSNTLIKPEIYLNNKDKELTYSKLELSFTSTLSQPLNDQPTFNFSVAPNPFRTYPTVFIDGKSGESFQISILDASGKLIFEFNQKFEISRNGVILDQLDHFPKGLYFIRISNGSNQVSKKLLKL